MAKNLVWGPGSLISGIPDALAAETNYDLDDFDDSIAFVFQVPFGGTIDRVGFAVNVFNGAPPDYNVGLVTLDASGDPTTAAYGGSTPATYTPSTTGWFWVTLAVSATAVAGDWCAVRIWPTGTAPTPTDSIDILDNVTESVTFPHLSVFGTIWTGLQGGFPPIAARYDDGVVYGIATNDVTMTPAFDDNDNPDEYGCKFTVPMDMTVFGVRVPLQYANANASLEVKLYNSASSLLATATVDDEDKLFSGSSSQGANDLMFDSAIDLVAGNTYYIAVHATHATATILLTMYDFPDADSRAFFPEGVDWIYVTRNNGGAWTEDADRLIPFALLANDYTLPAGGGGGMVESGYAG